MSMEILKELTETDYQLWKRHPISKILFQFLEDQGANLTEVAMDNWLNGTMQLALDQELRHKIQFCKELIDLRVDDIKGFYQLAGKLDGDAK